MLNQDFSEKAVAIISTLLTISLFMHSPFLTCFLCVVGIVFLLYLVIIQKEHLLGKIIPFAFYAVVLCLIIFDHMQ